MSQRPVSFNKFARSIKRKWMQLDRSLYWGDNLDVRYYLCWKLQGIKNKRILDIGCGPGVILSEMDSSNRKFGIDLAQASLHAARSMNPEAGFFVSDMHRLPFKEKSFDIVLLNAMLPLANDKAGLLASIHSLLKPGGTLFLVTHNRDYYEYSKNSSLANISELEGYLAPFFRYQLTGFNPLPRYPFFLPNVLVDKVPFIWNIIIYMSEHNILPKKSCGIYVEAVKK